MTFRRIPMVFLTSLALGLVSTASAQPAFTFTTPDAPIPSGPADGLNGTIWSSDDIAPVDDLVTALAYINANPASATMVSTAVDYPNGTDGSTSTSTPFRDALGVDAVSLSDPSVGDRPVLNSIMLFDGFLRVESPSVMSLGLGSDDGSAFSIQGTVIVNNDGLHGFPGNPGPVSVEFTTPGLYALDILFFESQASGWGVEFFLGDGAADAPVPTRMLQRFVPEPGFGGALAMLGLYLVRQRRRRDCGV